MTVEEAIIYGKQYLSSTHTKMILADLLGKNSLELFLILKEVLTEEQEENYKRKVAMLTEECPLQYVIGNVNFYGRTFLVDERVLIPRFETEELVEHTIAKLKNLFPEPENIRGIDLGCGSGVIGLTIKNMLPEIEMTLVDISKDALEVSRMNGQKLNLSVNYLESDFLEKAKGPFDFIVSNPPYIMESEEIESLVRDNEPHLALYAGTDGLDCYRKILSSCKQKLNKKFLIAFEIGMTQKEAITSLALEYLGSVEITCEKDLQGRDRILLIESRKETNLASSKIV